MAEKRSSRSGGRTRGKRSKPKAKPKAKRKAKRRPPATRRSARRPAAEAAEPRGAARRATRRRDVVREKPTVSRVSRLDVFERLQNLLGRITGREPEEILPSMRLREDLLFTDRRLRALADDINREFEREEVHITGGEVQATKTVEQLTDAVWAKIPPEHRKEP